MSSNPIISGKRNGISNWLRQFSTVVDCEHKTYKLQESLLGFIKWGTFKPLPEIKYILIFKQFFVKCESCSVEDFENQDLFYYQTSLVHGNNRRIIIHETKVKTSAFETARNLAQALNLKIKDAASIKGQGVWL
ncbi:MAG: hypothetical protein JSU07_04150 [Bacteroidetes bacterium]|nr:hypothetical protein [Bacteroidota bacterium]